MRLLEYGEDGELRVTADLVDEAALPRYAILSHTWGAEVEEVTFEDLATNTGKDRSGYKKIQFCGEQAKGDGLQYFWVDTCCINKANKAEHSLAIRSMFRWYRNAARCYVYLSDVSVSPLGAEGKASIPLWDSDFRQSRWFSRGWTLQELLAPSLIEFFSCEWHKLGDRISLKSQIHEVTTIPHDVLEGAPLSQSSVDERLRWRQNRYTKLKEDAAYSLSGIFDVDIAPVYGEGTEEAFRRLHDKIRKQEDSLRKREECLRDLRTTDPRNDKKRIESTKGGLLEDSYRWIFENPGFQQWHDSDQSQLLWIKGDPGKGKTMLLCGIIDELKKSIAKTDLLSYFFCQATDARINNATAVLRGLQYLLVDQQPSLVSHIRRKYDHAGKALFEDANAWIALSEIFTSILQDSNLGTMYLIIDALDECMVDLPKLLNFIVEQSSVSPRIKWIVSSRNWPSIEEQLAKAGQRVRLSLELNADSVSAAVNVFIQQKVQQLVRGKKYDNKTEEAVQSHFSSNADGTFLWVALVYQNLKDVPKRNVIKRLNDFPPGLDLLYERMMQQLSSSEDASVCKEILAIAATVYRPVRLEELLTLTEQLEDATDDAEDMQEIIGHCGSFLTLRENTIYFVHQSAKDFLLEKASGNIFPCGKRDVHRVLFARSLRVMSISLKRDIYDLHAPGYPIEKVQPPQPDPLVSSRYSCIYWIDHLYDWNIISSAGDLVDLQDGGSIDKFLRQRYLYWLEALSLCKNIPKGVVSMAKLESIVQKQGSTSTIRELVHDARRFVMYHKGAIEKAPLQTYISALVFSPRESLIRDLFQHEAPPDLTIKPAILDKWGACLQTLEGHSNGVSSAAFSPDSTRIASASGDNTVKIWDASSGEHLHTLEGHSDLVMSVNFSYDSTLIVSGSYDRTINIWDSRSGEHLHTLKGHSSVVNSVAFSHNSTRIASASGDNTVKIWDASSGEHLHTLEGHSESVMSVAFSHDSTLIASGSYDKTVKIWDTSSGEHVHTLEDHIGLVFSVAFSHNSTRIASASWDQTVKIWDSRSGEHLHTLEGHSNRVRSVAFSHNSTQIASASEDYTVKIWNASSGEHLYTLKGHNSFVSSVAFSHDSTRIVSGSRDDTVKIWDSRSGEHLHTLKGHSDCVFSLVFSHDLTRIASASRDNTVMIWDASSGEHLHTLEDHSDWVWSVAFSHDSTLIASGSYDKTAKIWDTSSGEHVHTLEGHIGPVSSVTFSHNSTRIASASWDGAVKIWDSRSGEHLHTLEGHSNWARSVAFSHNSALIASGSSDKTVKIWNASSGEHLYTLEGHNGFVSSVAFSHDSTLIASSSYDKTVKIWDASNGQCLRVLGVDRILSSIRFSSAGFCLDTAEGVIVIGNPTTPSGTTAVIDTQPPQYQCTALSSDNTWITYNSKNVLRLPPDYRPTASAVSGTMIAIGGGSGKVWICNLDPNVFHA